MPKRTRKPKNISAGGSIGENLPAPSIEDEVGGYVTLPSAHVGNCIVESLIAVEKKNGAGIDSLPEDKKVFNRKTSYTVLTGAKEGSRRIITESKKAKTIVELSNIEILSGNNKALKMLFVFLITKANLQAVHYGVLCRTSISFSLQELVDLGLYKNIRTAKKGFDENFDLLKTISASSTTISYGKKKEETGLKGASPFRVAIKHNNERTVILEEFFPWAELCSKFSKLPKYYFQLSNRASDLLLYICTQARNNTKDLSQRGYFTIGFKALQWRLRIPAEDSPTAKKDPYRTLLQPIDDAIEEIEEAHRKYLGNDDLQLFPVYDSNAGAARALNHGYLKVSLKGELAASYLKVESQRVEQKAKAEKRKEKIIEKAIEGKAKAAAAAELEAQKAHPPAAPLKESEQK